MPFQELWFCCQCWNTHSILLVPRCIWCEHDPCSSCVPGVYAAPGDQLSSPEPPSADPPSQEPTPKPETWKQVSRTSAEAQKFRRHTRGRIQRPLFERGTYDRLMMDPNEFSFFWEHQIVPFLVTFLPMWLKAPPGASPDKSYSVDVFSGPKQQSLGYRFVHITAARPKSLASRVFLAQSIRIRLPTCYRDTVKFVFIEGVVERLCDARGESEQRPDYICAPERPHYEEFPSMGASIGTEGDQTTAATFGGRVILKTSDGDDVECLLTCSHPFDNAELGSVITQPSPQEATSLSERITNINALISDRVLLDDHYLSLKNDLRKCQKILDGYPQEEEKMRFGTLLAASGERAIEWRLSSQKPNVTLSTGGPDWNDMVAQVEMDWAIGPIYDSRSGDNRLPSTDQRFFTNLTRDQSHSLFNGDHNRNLCRDVGEFKPSEEVYSIGRTSGLQRGRISEVPSIIRFRDRPDDRYNREWVVLQHEKDRPDEGYWISHGMGAPGDSGSWLIGENNVLYGMIWGRNTGFGTGPRKAIFTPIIDVFNDIADALHGEPPALPQSAVAPVNPHVQKHAQNAPVNPRELPQDSDVLVEPVTFDEGGQRETAPVHLETVSKPNETYSQAASPSGFSAQVSGSMPDDLALVGISSRFDRSLEAELESTVSSLFGNAWSIDTIHEPARSATARHSKNKRWRMPRVAIGVEHWRSFSNPEVKLKVA